MANTLQIKRNSSGIPSNGSLVAGELAVNTANGNLWVGNTAGNGVIHLNPAFNGTLSGTLTTTAADIGGGYGGSTGVSISDAGNIMANGGLVVDGTTSLSSDLTLYRTVNDYLRIGHDSDTHYISTVGSNRDLHISASGTVDAADLKISSDGDVTLSGDLTVSSGVKNLTGTLGTVSFDSGGNGMFFSRNSTNYIHANGGTSSALDLGGKHSIVFQTGSSISEKMRLTSAGRLGLSTSAPDEILHVAGNAKLVGDLIVGSSRLAGHSSGSAKGLQIKSADATQAGLELRDTNNNWKATFYGTTSYYGFLDAPWGSWDVRKTVNGALEIDQGSGLETVFTTSGGTLSGNLTLATSLSSASGDLELHRAGSNRLTLSGSSVVINDSGANIDFRVEGDGDANLIRTDASNDRVGIKTNAPAYTFHCVGTGYFSQNVTLGSGLTVGGNTALTGELSLTKTVDSGTGALIQLKHFRSSGATGFGDDLGTIDHIFKDSAGNEDVGVRMVASMGGSSGDNTHGEESTKFKIQTLKDSGTLTDSLVLYDQGVTLSGTVTVNNNLTVAGSCTFAALSGTTATFSGTITGHGSIDLQDNDKLLLGAGNDLEIYHDGDHARINNATGNLNIQADDFHLTDSSNTAVSFIVDHDGATGLYFNQSAKLTTTATGVTIGSTISLKNSGNVSYIQDSQADLRIESNTMTLRSLSQENYITCALNGAVSLFYDSVKKFETSNSGGVFTGASGRTTLTLIGAKTSDGNFADIYGSNNSDTGHAQISFRRDGANDATAILFYTEATGASMAERMRISNIGDISFYEDTGTTAKFYWSAANERLNLSASDYQLQLTSGSHIWFTKVNSSGTFGIHRNGVGDILSMGTGGSDINAHTHFRPYNNNQHTCGTAANIWSTVYGNTGYFYSSMRRHSRGYSAASAKEYPLNYSSGGETVWDINPQWNDTELRAFFNSTAVAFVNDSTAPAGYAVEVTGNVNIGPHYGSPFPMIPVEPDTIIYCECWVKDTGAVGHYMGSIEYKEDFGQPSGGSGNPGSYGYWVMINTSPGTSGWTKMHGYIGPNTGSSTGQWETGTKYFSPQALFNYTHSSGTRATRISGWKYIRVSQSGKRTFSDPIGINTTADSQEALSIKSTGDGRNALVIKDNAGDAMFNIRQSANDCLIRGYKDGGTQTLQFHSDGESYIKGGKLLIEGTESYLLDVQQTAVNWTARFKNTNGAYGVSIDTQTNIANNVANLACYVPTGLGLFFTNQGRLALGLTAPTSKLHLKDYTDSTLESGLCIERSADTAKTWINTRGGATNFNNQNHAGSAGLSYKWFADGIQKMDLSATGVLSITGSSTVATLNVNNASGHIRHIDFARTSNPTARIQVLEPGNAHTGSMGFWTSNASGGPNLVEAMRIHSNQCIGIGITPTTTRLDIQQSSGNILRCKGDSGNTRFAVGASGACTIEGNTGNYPLHITNADSGNKGLKVEGLTTLSGDLEVTKSSGATKLRLFSGNNDPYISFGDNNTNWCVGIDRTDSGAFKIGETSGQPGANNVLTLYNGNAIVTGDLEVQTTSGGELLIDRNGNSGVLIQQKNNGADDSGSLKIQSGTSTVFTVGGTERLSIASNSVDAYTHFRPYNNNQYTCGTAANRWSNGYFSDLNLSKSNSGGLGPVLTLDNAAGAASDSSAIGFASFGTSFYRASIKSLVGSAPYHGELIFSTGLGAISSLTERMRISPTEITATVPVRFNGGIRDDGGDYGMSGQVLSTNGNGEVHWVNGISGCEKIVTWNYPAGNSSGVSFSGSSATGTATITHNLNTQYVVVSAIDINGHDTTAAGEQVDMGYNLIVKCPTVNTITLHWDNGAPSNAVEFRVKIIG
mgnify:CR=1 FL=1